MTASIGPWTFSAMRGRMNVAAPTTAPLRRGMRIGRPVAQPAALTTTETATSFGAAWSKAWGYRAAIGGWGRVVDDTDTVCEAALIADCSVTIDKKSSGATLTTTWTIIPAIWWGANGQASIPVTGATPGILPIAGPVIDTTEPEAGYTIQVGLLAQTYESIVSTIQPPIGEGQREAVRRASADLGSEYTPADQVGTARCDVGVIGEEAARDVMRLARYQIGGFGSLKIGAAVLLAPLAIADAQVTWHPAVGLGNSKDTLVTVVYSLRLDDVSGEQDIAAATTVAIVQVASIWGQWQTVANAVCNGASDGLSASCGSTSFTIDATIVTKLRTITNELEDHTGKWVRILVRVNNTANGLNAYAGLSTTDTTEKTHPIWYGICKGMSIHGGSGSPGAQGVYTCTQVQDVLDQVFLTRWYEIGQNNKSANPGRVLPFNWDLGADRSPTRLGGNKYYDPQVSLSTDETDATASFYPHNRVTNTSAAANNSTWSMRQIVTTILGAFRVQYPNGPFWRLTGQLTALDKEMPSFDPHGRSVLDMLAELLSPRHSLTFRVTVSAEPEEYVELHVHTVVATNTAILGFGNIPANNLLAPLDLAKDGGTATTIKPFGSAGIGSALQGERFPAWNLNRDRARQVDAIYAEGGNPWIMATVGIAATTNTSTAIPRHMEYDWTATDQTAWLSASTKRRADPDLAHVYRRFRLRADWDGTTVGHTTNVIMAMGRTKYESSTPSLLYTEGGETGAFFVDPNENLPNPRNIKLTRCVPIPEGVDLSVSGAFGSGSTLNIPRGVAPGRPSIFGYIASTGKYENLGDTLSVTVDSESGTVELGHGAEDAAFIYAYLTAGNFLLVTMGFLGALPWRKSWRRAVPSRPRNLERAIFLHHPEMQYRQVLSGSIVGVNADGTARTILQDAFADKEIDDLQVGNGERLDLPLRIARFWYEDLHRAFSWTQSGTITYGDNQPPGQLITDVTLPLDAKRRYVEAVNAPVTVRSWDFRKASLSTSWECDRMAIGFDYRMVRREQAGRQFPEMFTKYQLGGG